MGKQWQAIVQKTSANQEFQEKLAKILSEIPQKTEVGQSKPLTLPGLKIIALLYRSLSN
jgi:hypothetical protein